MERLLTVAEVAHLLSVSPSRVYQMIATGELPAIQLSRKSWRVPESEVEALVARRAGGRNALVTS